MNKIAYWLYFLKQIISCSLECFCKWKNEKLLCINLFMILYALFPVEISSNIKMWKISFIKYNCNLFCLHGCRIVCRIVFLLSSFSWINKYSHSGMTQRESITSCKHKTCYYYSSWCYILIKRTLNFAFRFSYIKYKLWFSNLW